MIKPLKLYFLTYGYEDEYKPKHFRYSYRSGFFVKTLKRLLFLIKYFKGVTSFGKYRLSLP